MTQAIALVRDGDQYPSPSPLQIDGGNAFTPAANSLLMLTATFWGSTGAYNATAHAALLADDWEERADEQIENVGRVYVFSKLNGASPSALSAAISNDDVSHGTAFTLAEFTGNVTGASNVTFLASPNTYAETYAIPIPAFATETNSTYAIGIGGGDLPVGTFSDTAMVYQPHLYNAGSNGSSNQHYFAANKEATLLFEETQLETSMFVFEIIGELAGTPVLSAPTESAISAAGVTLGASTNEASGTAYFIAAALTADLVGITPAQIKAGTDAQDEAAILDDSVAVGSSPFTKAISGALTLSTNFVYAIVQNTNAQDSNIVTGTFATAGATIHGFRLPLVLSANVPAADESGLVAALYSDRSLATQVGITHSSAQIVSGDCVVTNAQFGVSPAVGDTLFMRVYRPAPATKSDNLDLILEVICVDLDTADKSFDGVS